MKKNKRKTRKNKPTMTFTADEKYWINKGYVKRKDLIKYKKEERLREQELKEDEYIRAFLYKNSYEISEIIENNGRFDGRFFYKAARACALPLPDCIKRLTPHLEEWAQDRDKTIFKMPNSTSLFVGNRVKEKKPITQQCRTHDKDITGVNGKIIILHEPIMPWTEQEKRQFLFAIIGVAAAFIIIAIIAIYMSR